MTTIRKAEVQVGDVGTVFELTFQDGDETTVDISSATVKQMVFGKPDGTSLIGTAAFKTDGSAGILTYTTVAGNIDQAGLWHVQGYVEMPTWKGHSSAKRFEVHQTFR
jgi:hypothetical protein